MTAPREGQVLQNILRRESRSLLQYAGDTFPWPTLEEGGAMPVLEKLAATGREAAGDLARFLALHRQSLPYLGAYPSHFTTLNFVSLENLLPRLIESEHEGIAQLERDLAVLTTEDARAEVEKILRLKKRNLEALRQIAAPAATPAC